jgi:3-phosphoshikimate 1-carboxyvinyltransferase
LETSAAWPAPTANGPVTAKVSLPGSKSLTNRALILAALSESPSRISAPLQARDTKLMIAALSDLGVTIQPDGADLMVRPGRLLGASVDCGLAGTVMRFVPPVAALASGDSLFDGDPHARTRPMGALIDALRQCGVHITDDGTGTLPFRVHGRGAVRGGAVELDASASSQFVSALLLAGARFDVGVDIRHIGKPVPSLPHIDMTVAGLRAAGVDVDDSTADRWVVKPGTIHAPDQLVEPDLSNAAPFLAAALVTGGSVTVPYWPEQTTQPGAALAELLAQMGAEISRGPAGLSVTGAGGIGPLIADLHEVGELTPVLAALCALSDGESQLTGIAHLRGHETDRLAAIQAELTALGGDVSQLDDGLAIRPAPLGAGLWHAYADHRMAQAGAVIGLAVPGVEVDDIASTTKTMADFPGLWANMLSQAGIAVE